MVKIIYHFPCPDGFGAAVVARRKFGADAEYLTGNYGKPFQADFNPEDEVYIVDYSLPRQQLLDIKSRVSKLVVLDHHDTAKENLDGIPDCIFDNSRSGIRLAWDYFFPNEDVPNWVQWVEDKDLWTYKLEPTRAFSCGLATLPFDFEVWGKLFDDSFSKELLDKGRVLLSYQDALVQRMADKPIVTSFKKFVIHAVPGNILQSEIGEYLNEKHSNDVAMIYYYEPHDGKFRCSFRSKHGSDINTRIITEYYSGGGHKNASGCSMLPEDFFAFLY